MDIITRLAQEFAEFQLHSVKDPDDVVNKTRLKLNDLDDPLDQAKFINVLIEKNRYLYETHLKTCTDKIKCPINYGHEVIAFFLNQELKRIGVKVNTDTFSNSEQEICNEKIDSIFEEIQTLKDGQQIIYEDLLRELNELKNLYFLGKRQWHQIWLGKVFDMTISGIIGETVSKYIINEIKNISLSLPQ